MRQPFQTFRLLLALPAALLLSSCSDQPLGPDEAPSFAVVICPDPDACGGGGDGPPPPPPPADTEPPETTIDSQPAVETTSTSATFTFTGSDNVTAPENLTFYCQLDGGVWEPCTSPRIYNDLALGSHTFQVRSMDAAGNHDPTPASYTWTVIAVGDPPPPSNNCLPGTYLSGSTCVQAPPGFYVATAGATSATPCAAGTFQPLSGQTSCNLAPAGTFVPVAAALWVTPCSPGTYQPLPGQSACLPAPAGGYVNISGAIAPILCLPGTFQPNTGATGCVTAPPGTFVNTTGAIALTPCPPGSYQPNSGQFGCIPAPAGRFVPGPGSPASIPCPVGTYQPSIGQSSCLNAPAGSYVDVTGAIAPTPCPEGTTTTGTGSTSASACVAPPPSFQFGGFLSPVRSDVLNVVQAGRAVPIKFSLGGDFGLAIFAAGSPGSAVIPCNGDSEQGTVASTLSAGNSSLSYDPATQTYTYVWKTDRNWGNSCRRLTVELTDGTKHSVDFRLAR